MPNTIVREIAPKSLFEDASAVTSSTEDFEQGDIMVWDSGTGTIIKAALEADGANMLGLAKVTVIDGKVKSPYQGTAVDAAGAIVALPGPVYGVVAKMIAKTGDAFAPGALVYADPATSSRGVSSAGTKAIGVYQGKTIASAAAGQEVECLIGARFPSDALIF